MVLVLLRDHGNYGVCGPMFYCEAMEMEDELNSYEYWKVVSFLELLHCHNARMVIDDKLDISFAEREAKKAKKGVNKHSEA